MVSPNSSGTSPDSASPADSENPWIKMANEVLAADSPVSPNSAASSNNPTNPDSLVLAPVHGESEKSPREFVDFKDLEKVCNFDGAALFGHGTATADATGEDHELVDQIFEEGIAAYTSIGAIASNDKHDEQNPLGAIDLDDNAICIHNSLSGAYDPDRVQPFLNHWPHRAARNIILMRFPEKYFIPGAQPSESHRSFYTVHPDSHGSYRNYIDRRFIIGNYDAMTGQVELNPHFESEISGDFKTELDRRFAKAELNFIDRISAPDPIRKAPPTPDDSLDSSSDFSNADAANWTESDLDWE